MKHLKERKWLFILITLLLIIVLTPFTIIFLINIGNPYERYLLDKHIPSYLEKMGYTDENLIDAHYAKVSGLNNEDYYDGIYTVKFKDEPNMFYYYGLSKKGKNVTQYCKRYDGTKNTITGETKHSENDCVSNN